MTCYKLEFSWNFARFRRFESQLQRLNEQIATECNPLNVLCNIMFLALIRRIFSLLYGLRARIAVARLP